MSDYVNVYEVTIHNEYNCDFIWYLRDKYVKWFKTKKKAIAYARSIKKELKTLCREIYKCDDNIICIDVNKYCMNLEDLDEQLDGIVYSLNIVGKY